MKLLFKSYCLKKWEVRGSVRRLSCVAKFSLHFEEKKMRVSESQRHCFNKKISSQSKTSRTQYYLQYILKKNKINSRVKRQNLLPVANLLQKRFDFFFHLCD